MNAGDMVIDGGNSFFEDSERHNALLKEQGIHFFDAGTSGGMSGANANGNFMIGGDSPEAFKTIDPSLNQSPKKMATCTQVKLGVVIT